MIRVGLVNIDVSHPQKWGPIMTESGRGGYVAILNDGFRGDDEVEAFMKANGVENRCTTISELAALVDVVFIQGCNWDRHLDYAVPVLEAGKPVFIDKPIVGNIADCTRLETLADSGKVIIGSSSVRYCAEIEAFLALSEEERGKIMHVFGTAGTDEFNYAIHIVEAIGGLMGRGAVSTRMIDRASLDGKTCETFAIDYGAERSAIYSTFHGVWMPFEIIVTTTSGTYHFEIDPGAIYKALIDRIFDLLEKDENRLADVRSITESIKIMLAGRISRITSGEAIRLDEVSADDPGFDGDLFEKSYAAKASKIYL